MVSRLGNSSEMTRSFAKLFPSGYEWRCLYVLFK